MIDFYTWTTPNGRKIAIALEEMGLEYSTRWVNIGAGQQFSPEFLGINPNNKIPAIVDHAPEAGSAGAITVFESGAILTYLAEKTGRFLPASGAARYAVLEWMTWQAAGLGPMMGQAYHFRGLAEPVPYAAARYETEVARLFGVLDRRLAQVPYLAGDYSIADMATYPWVAIAPAVGVERGSYPHVERWADAVGARDAVARGMGLVPPTAG